MEINQDENNFDENDIEVFDDFIEYYGFEDDQQDDPEELNFESDIKIQKEDDFVNDGNEIFTDVQDFKNLKNPKVKSVEVRTEIIKWRSWME